MASCWLPVGAREARAAHPVYARRVLRDQDDAETSLAEAAGGQALVVVVMKGHWCQVCSDQLARLADKQQELSALGARLVGLNADSPAANKGVLAARGIRARVLSDAKHELLAALGLWLPSEGHPMPAIVVFDRCGDEVARWVGRQPGDRPDGALLRVLRRLSQDRRACSRPSA